MYLLLDPALVLSSLYYAFVFGVLYLVIVAVGPPFLSFLPAMLIGSSSTSFSGRMVMATPLELSA